METTMISIETTKNGWVVSDRWGTKNVFINEIEYLTHVYQLTCNRSVLNKVVIQREIEEPKEQP